jgi:SAM-dependent methyltransferase
MTPSDVGRSYDTIARRWVNPEHPLTGLPQHERALRFSQSRGYALDVGTGCNRRLIDLLHRGGFQIDAVDVSEQMIALARQQHKSVAFHHADICEWTLPRSYDFITGWDSIWHVPLDAQPAVFAKLCAGLNSGGVFIFSLGGTDEPDERRDSFMGPPMYHATMGIPQALALLDRCGCVCRHLEYDQYPESHAYIIAQKR